MKGSGAQNALRDVTLTMSALYKLKGVKGDVRGLKLESHSVNLKRNTGDCWGEVHLNRGKGRPLPRFIFAIKSVTYFLPIIDAKTFYYCYKEQVNSS